MITFSQSVSEWARAHPSTHSLHCGVVAVHTPALLCVTVTVTRYSTLGQLGIGLVDYGLASIDDLVVDGVEAR